jgi:GDPmannose 4,6-dehydratase
MTKRALIIGIAGQDGSYLSRLLLDKGYEVHGTSRNVANARFDGLRSLEVLDRVRLYTADLTNYHSGIELLRAVKPLEIYNLSAQSSVGLSFEQPIETLNSIVNATLNLLEAIRLMGGEMRLYNASSSEMYGDTASRPADENTFFRPHSPYGVSKAAAHWLVENYRKAYGLFACSGIMFNHESPLRNERFVTQKIVRTAVDIRRGAARKLTLGNLAVVRDWGWAPEYVEAMWLMLQQHTPEDYVIATGNAASLEEFTKTAFEQVDLDWRDYVDHDPGLLRPYEVDYTVGKPGRAAERLLWTARLTMPEIVTKLVDAEQQRRERPCNQIACGTPE